MSVIDLIKDIFEQLKNDDSIGIEEKYGAIKSFLPKHSDIFSSQEGEDVLIKRLLKSLYAKKGFYVDIGAYDPVRFSNTFHFYLQGWSGINIDPNESAIDEFNSFRPRDCNLQMGVAEESDELDYYSFQEGAFNTFSKERADVVKKIGKSEYLGLSKIKVESLANTLNKYLPKKQDITFLNIDVEGLELSVLNSNDWAKYRPLIILIEALNSENEKDIDEYLTGKKYLKIAKTKNTMIFVEEAVYKKLESDDDVIFESSKRDCDKEVLKHDAFGMLLQDTFALYKEVEENKVVTKQIEINQLNIENKKKADELSLCKASIQHKDKVIATKTNEVNEQERQMMMMDKVLADKDGEVHACKKLLQDKDHSIEKKIKVIEDNNETMQKKDRVIVEKDLIIDNNCEIIKEKEISINMKDSVINEQAVLLNKLLESIGSICEESTFTSPVSKVKAYKKMLALYHAVKSQ